MPEVGVCGGRKPLVLRQNVTPLSRASVKGRTGRQDFDGRGSVVARAELSSRTKQSQICLGDFGGRVESGAVENECRS
jgi:hypothetical protein